MHQVTLEQMVSRIVLFFPLSGAVQLFLEMFKPVKFLYILYIFVQIYIYIYG